MAEDEIPLPEDIIRHIQSFLTAKQAAKTSILSKSWYHAWLTCPPNLNFDQRDFGRNRGIEFCVFVMKTMQRYQYLNLMSQSFRLLMDDSHAYELIAIMMAMGATDLHFELLSRAEFDLPDEVIRSETLVKLSLNGCTICQVYRKANCPRLKSLSLCRVYFEDSITFWEIISSCPLIEDLSLSKCSYLFKFSYSKMLELSPFIEHNEIQNMRYGPIDELHKLKSLKLVEVHIDSMFFRDFSSRFPCLKDLAVHDCPGHKEIQISSPSLECISFVQGGLLRADFDVPSIRKFKFLGLHLPSVSFQTASTEWESDVSVIWKSDAYRKGRCRCASTSWFAMLNKFLTNLSPSKICLSLNIETVLKKRFQYNRATQGLPKPVVENLTVHASSSFVRSSAYSALLDGFFWSCRPKFITLYWFPESCIEGKGNNYLLEILCKRLIQQGSSRDCCIPNRSVFCQGDLEDVNVEYFEETLVQWRPLPWNTLLDDSASPRKKRKIRFQLKWGTLEPTTL